eukprot:1183712-Prorocentrum_minimum.AAC.3
MPQAYGRLDLIDKSPPDPLLTPRAAVPRAAVEHGARRVDLARVRLQEHLPAHGRAGAKTGGLNQPNSSKILSDPAALHDYPT